MQKKEQKNPLGVPKWILKDFDDGSGQVIEISFFWGIQRSRGSHLLTRGRKGTKKNVVYLYVMPRGSFKNRRFVGTYRPHHQGGKKQLPRKNFSTNQQPKHAARK
jgi:hypothetical protein